MGIAWRRTLEERNERFGTMADYFGVDLDLVLSGGKKAEFGGALDRCLTCERQTECQSWQATLATERSSTPDFCPNLSFFGLHSTRSPITPREPQRSRVIRFLDFVDDLLTCVSSVEARHWPPDSALRGIGIDPAGIEWRTAGDHVRLPAVLELSEPEPAGLSSGG